LYTYSLEDANIQELAKNGFGVTLDTALMNNTKPAGELATQVLQDTDWKVDSEKFIEFVEDNLVYLSLMEKGSDEDYAPIYKIIEPNNPKDGVKYEKISNIWKTFGGKTLLGFYSSCTSEPVYF
jgi:hypothetical protein